MSDLVLLENILPQRILKNKKFNDFHLVSFKVQQVEQLDGFLSNIYRIDMVVENETTKKHQTHSLICKIIKDSGNLRDEFNLDAMTVNELKFYTLVIPSLEKFLKGNPSQIVADWAPKFYYGFYGFDKDFGIKERRDGMLIIDDLTAQGYRMGPRESLDENHIILTMKSIASYHGSMYAFKVKQPELFKEIVNSLEDFPFYRDKKNVFDAFYSITLDRMRLFFQDETGDVFDDVNKLHAKYIDKPSRLLQRFLIEDSDFDIIIHGDYNRGNVMFEYESADGFDSPQSVKMFDFQFLKYASPVLDLSFLLFMNVEPDMLAEKLDKFLKIYHSTLVATFKSVLAGRKYDENLPLLSFGKFMGHFGKFAFYGCLIACWFLPCMMTEHEMCDKIVQSIYADLYGEVAKATCLSVREPRIVERVKKIVQLAQQRGYMARLLSE